MGYQANDKIQLLLWYTNNYYRNCLSLYDKHHVRHQWSYFENGDELVQSQKISGFRANGWIIRKAWAAQNRDLILEEIRILQVASMAEMRNFSAQATKLMTFFEDIRHGWRAHRSPPPVRLSLGFWALNSGTQRQNHHDLLSRWDQMRSKTKMIQWIKHIILRWKKTRIRIG